MLAMLAILIQPGLQVEPVVRLDRVSARHAEALAGRRMKVFVPAATPPYRCEGVVVTGAGDRDDVERTVHLPADRFPDEGEPLWLTGRLAVIRHPPGNGFPGFVEIRVADARPWD